MKYTDIQDDVIDLIGALGVHPFMDETETFIDGKIIDINDRSSAVKFVTEYAPSWFQSYTDPPNWIQEPNWKFLNGKPMVFVGQINTNSRFHDDASFYVFWDPETGITENVIQIG